MADFLDTLEAVQVDPLILTRDKLVEDIELQKRAVRAELTGTPFSNGGKRAFHTWHRLRKGEWWTRLKAATPRWFSVAACCSKQGRTSRTSSTSTTQSSPSLKEGELDYALKDAMKRRERPERR